MLMRRLVLAVIAGLALTMALSASALAADRVGVINLELIMEESKAGKQANAVLQAAVEERRQLLAPQEARLEELAAILDNGDTLSEEERAATQAEFDALAEEYVAAVNRYDAEVQQLLEQLRSQLLADIGVVLQRVGDSRGFDLILDISAAYYFRRTVDLTFEVIREYDDLWEQARQGGS